MIISNKIIKYILCILWSGLFCSYNSVLASENTSVHWVSTETRTFLSPESPFYSSRNFTAMPAEQKIGIQISLRLRNEEKLKAMGQAVNDPANPEYGRFLTKKQLEQEYIPTSEQVRSVELYLQNNGFTQIEASANRLFISAVGNAPQINKAFNSQLVSLRENHLLSYANITPAQVPMELARTVLSVQGLQNFAGPRPRTQKPLATQGDNITPEAKPVRPAWIPTIYNADSLGPATQTSLGIVTQGIFSGGRNVALDAIKVDYPDLPTKIVKTGAPDDSYDTTGVIEWMMDSQASVAAAGGKLKNLIFYVSNINSHDGKFNSDSMLTQAFNKIVMDNEAQVISVSLGWCEEDAYNSGAVAADSQIFALAVAQGQTFVIASGDTGNTCGIQGALANGPENTVDWPEASSDVISVGGTKLWTYSPAAYGKEEVWNAGVEGGVLHASGGGYSRYQARPAWQTLSVVPANKRAVPDVAFNAAKETGILLTAMNYLTKKPEILTEPHGGTSLSAPVFAGFYARLQTKFGNKLGFAGPLIYQAGKKAPNAFHDITVGGNGKDRLSGYQAGVGWDYATGWGSMDVAQFSQYLSTIIHE